MSKVHPAILKQLQTGRRFLLFFMAVTAVYTVGTLIEYFGGWDAQIDTRAILGGSAFFFLSAGLYFALSRTLRRLRKQSS